ncbi:MAG: Cys-tRNA(Pro) deacylase [Gammaproteobacteria bacterium]|nr:MAG: Cys-tRNA(Pro) deacylase [Gammaproteobacteria bacterium]
MTPAVRQLKKQNIAFTLHQYQHDANATSYGEEAAEKLNINAAQVFKTLVLNIDIKAKNSLAVAIVPVMHQLNLKAFAKVLGVKKVQLAEAKQVEATTGYVLGGVSPIGQKKCLNSVIDESANKFSTIFISGGKRGLEIELKVTDLANVINATMAQLA